MNSGIYTAYSGLQAQYDALNMLANNLANLNTTGFKEETAFFQLLNKSLDLVTDSKNLNSVINNQPVLMEGLLNITDGSLIPTQRDLDVALTGKGFLAVATPRGVRYTRAGNLKINAESLLATSDGFPVLGVEGRPISLGRGKININENGDVFLNDQQIDRLKVVTFDNSTMFVREGNSLLLPRESQGNEKTSDAKVKQGYLEQSNVNPVSAVVELVEIMRQFEAIQKSLSLVMNDMNKKSIEKLGS